MKGRSLRKPRGSARFLSFALTAMVLAARPGAAAPATSTCQTPASVPGIGRACPEGRYWRLTLADGSTFLTHGQDDILSKRAFAQSGGAMPSCASNQYTESYNVVVYAHPSDLPNRYTARLAPLRAAVAQANAALRAEAALFSRTIDYRFLCANGLVVVEDAPVLLGYKSVTLETLITSLRALGFTNPNAKYWVYFDGHPDGALDGVGTLENDDRLSANNASNFGPSYGVTWGVDLEKSAAGAVAVMMHESAHTMGAVQNTAPHSTGAGHCTDGLDAMCYPDGGPSASNFTDKACAVVRFDCNHDDYFNPVPGAKNYLANHWNLASPFNRFVAGCTYQDGVLIANGPEAKGVTSATVTIPSACQTHAFALGAVVPVPVGVAPAVGSALAAIPVPDVNVCWYAGAALVRCDANLGAEDGAVPQNATSARITLAAGAAAAYVLSVI
jgi:hypothetical protein